MGDQKSLVTFKQDGTTLTGSGEAQGNTTQLQDGKIATRIRHHHLEDLDHLCRSWPGDAASSRARCDGDGYRAGKLV